MLAGAVHALKGLLVEYALEAVLSRGALHELHSDLVMVGSDIRGIEYRSELVLSGSDLVVLGLGAYAESPELFVEVCHISVNAGLDSAEVMILKLLSLGCGCAEESSAR